MWIYLVKTKFIKRILITLIEKHFFFFCQLTVKKKKKTLYLKITFTSGRAMEASGPLP